jgi:hypothetical protein
LQGTTPGTKIGAMSLRHMVLIRFTEGTGDDQIAAFATGLDSLPGQIDQIRSYEHGRDAGIRPGSWDYGLVAEFDSPGDFLAYLEHPAHKAVVRDLLDPISAERTSVQIQR